MAVFTELESGNLDWRRLDVCAIVGKAGIASIEDRHRASCEEWLRRENYRVDSLVGNENVELFNAELFRLLRWEEQFGYRPESDWRNLDAFRDGFHFEVPEAGGRVLEITRPDLVWEQDPRWLLGLLAVASEYSHTQLALGRRFFTLLVFPAQSGLAGKVFEQIKVPPPVAYPSLF